MRGVREPQREVPPAGVRRYTIVTPGSGLRNRHAVGTRRGVWSYATITPLEASAAPLGAAPLGVFVGVCTVCVVMAHMSNSTTCRIWSHRRRTRRVSGSAREESVGDTGSVMTCCEWIGNCGRPAAVRAGEREWRAIRNPNSMFFGGAAVLGKTGGTSLPAASQCVQCPFRAQTVSQRARAVKS
eukprot:89401-Prorocentrum_minimum.AAC.3